MEDEAIFSTLSHVEADLFFFGSDAEFHDMAGF
jgi:hypothetical protein